MVKVATESLEIEMQLSDGIEWQGCEATVWYGVAY